MNELKKIKGNGECIDCGRKTVNWVSVNLGIFICMRCAGIHRSLGTHISFVRSLTLDNLTEKEYQKLKEIGNEKAKKIYEANVPSHIQRPNEFSDEYQIEKWIKDKYLRLLYKSDEDILPPTKISQSIDLLQL
jgi:stromal membrane-associated protein